MTGKRLALALTVGVLALAGVGYFVFARPWLTPPPEPPAQIAQRWAQLESWATSDPASGKAETQLLTALQRFGASANARALSRRVGPKRFERLDPDPLAQQAIDALSAWAAADGGLGSDLCLQSAAGSDAQLPNFKLYELGRLAVQSATSGDDPGLLAALRLAAMLRQRGGLLAFLVGCSLAEEAAETTSERKLVQSLAFARYQPREAEIFPALAREAVCSARLVETAAAAEQHDNTLSTPFWERQAAKLGPLQREVQMVKWYEGLRFAKAYPVRDDIPALAKALALPDRQALPASWALRAMALDMEVQTLKAREKIVRYRAYLQPSSAAPTP